MSSATLSDTVVTGIGLVSPEANSPAEVPVNPRSGGAIDEGWFDVKAELGGRGYKYIPAAGQYLLAAARRALADSGDGYAACDEERRGAAVGTNSSASALHDAMDRTVVAGHSNDLSPATAPFFSINLLGSQLSAHHGIKGFNLTVTSPRVAGLEALEIGSRSVYMGRARLQLAGATEAPLPAGEAGVEASEAGAVVIVIEPRQEAVDRGAAIYGQCWARTFFLPPRLLQSPKGCRAATGVVHDALRALGGDVDSLTRIRLVVDGSKVSEVVEKGLRQAQAGDRTERCGAAFGSGRPGCLEPMLQLAALLAEPGCESVLAVAAGQGNVALVRTSTTMGGLRC